MGMPSGRFFGWVIGGTHPAALAADWLTSAWDQNTAMRHSTPGVVAVEDAAAAWALDLLGLPGRRRRRVRHRRHHGQLHRARGGAPAGARRRGLGRRPRRPRGRSAGPGARRRGAARDPRPRAALPRARDADRRRRRRPGPARRRRPRRALWRRASGPTIVCLQAGNLHSGAFDPMAEAIEVAHRHGAWVHVDGAFGLWAAASPRLRQPRRRATSAPTRGPPTRTRPSTCRTTAAWRSSRTPSRCAGPSACTPSTSRRSAGRATRWRRCPSCPGALAACPCGRCCGRWAAAGSRTWSTAWWRTPGRSPTGSRRSTAPRSSTTSCSPRSASAFGSDERTRAVTARVLADGVTWMSGSRWQGRDVLRVSVSNWSTDAEDVARSVDAVRRAASTD